MHKWRSVAAQRQGGAGDGRRSGIGRACAQLFAKEGASVVVSDVAVEGGEETPRLIEEDRGEGTFCTYNAPKIHFALQLTTGAGR